MMMSYGDNFYETRKFVRNLVYGTCPATFLQRVLQTRWSANRTVDPRNTMTLLSSVKTSGP